MASLTDSERYITGWRLGVIITSLFFGTFLLALDTTIVNVAIPKITTDFRALDDVAWYGSAYLVTLTALQPVYGSMYKFFDASVVYRISIVIFEVGSVLCAAASSSSVFILGRALAGFGGAGLLQGALSIISQVIPLEKRPMYMGIVISVFGISVCIGPPLGGVFTEHSSWRWCFWINLPIGVVVLALITIFLKIRSTGNEYHALSFRKKLTNMDPLGCVVLIGALVCLLLALQWGGQTKSWNSSAIIGLLVGFIILTVCFVVVQWRVGDRALIPLRVFRQRSIWTGAMVLFCIGASTYINTFFLPFYFQAVHGIGPVASGVDFIPFLLPQIFAVGIVGVIVARYWGHYVPIMIVGELICVVGTAFLAQLEIDTSTVKWATYLVVAGAGMGMAMQLPYTAVQLTLPEKDIPTGNAIAVLFQQLGGAIAISLGQTITLTTIVDQIPSRLPQLSPQAVMQAGAAGLTMLARTPEQLFALRIVWNEAISRTMILSVAVVAASVPFTMGMNWLDARKVAKEKKAEEDDSKRLVVPATPATSVNEKKEEEKAWSLPPIEVSRFDIV